MHLRLGPPDGNHLVLRPLRRSHPGAEDFWDGNWLKVEVAARGGAFAGRFEADLRADELAAFAAALSALRPGQPAKAALESMEGWVAVRLTLDARGRLEGTAEVRDDPALGAALRFPLALELDQLPGLLAALDAILHAFPVVGSPDAEGSVLLADEDGPGDA